MTTPTVSAPISLATPAITGAAPVPVPPPMPAVMKTMSAPSIAARICSWSSTAALRPISGLPPEPSPSVSLAPIWILWGARFPRRTCESVFVAMNSTPRSRAWIIRFTAFPPPPPTPTTLITVVRDGPSSTSSKLNAIFGSPPVVWFVVCCYHCLIYSKRLFAAVKWY